MRRARLAARTLTCSGVSSAGACVGVEESVIRLSYRDLAPRRGRGPVGQITQARERRVPPARACSPCWRSQYIGAGQMLLAHVLATFQRMFWTKISACFGCVLARVSDAKVRMLCLPRLWRHLFTAAGPHWWQRRQGTHTATTGLTRARKGPRYAKRPLSPVGTSPCCQALVRRRSSSGPARGPAPSPRGRCPRGCRR